MKSISAVKNMVNTVLTSNKNKIISTDNISIPFQVNEQLNDVKKHDIHNKKVIVLGVGLLQIIWLNFDLVNLRCYSFCSHNR